jgi:hypothetical protein
MFLCQIDIENRNYNILVWMIADSQLDFYAEFGFVEINTKFRVLQRLVRKDILNNGTCLQKKILHNICN